MHFSIHAQALNIGSLLKSNKLSQKTSSLLKIISLDEPAFFAGDLQLDQLRQINLYNPARVVCLPNVNFSIHSYRHSTSLALKLATASIYYSFRIHLFKHVIFLNVPLLLYCAPKITLYEIYRFST